MRTGLAVGTTGGNRSRVGYARIACAVGSAASSVGISSGSATIVATTAGTATQDRQPASTPRRTGVSTKWKEAAEIATITTRRAARRDRPLRWVRSEVMTKRTGQYHRYMP